MSIPKYVVCDNCNKPFALLDESKELLNVAKNSYKVVQEYLQRGHRWTNILHTYFEYEGKVYTYFDEVPTNEYIEAEGLGFSYSNKDLCEGETFNSYEIREATTKTVYA